MVCFLLFLKDSQASVSGTGTEGLGTVKIYHEGQWGTVCDDVFDKNDARVVCAMIGHHTLYVRYIDSKPLNKTVMSLH